MNAFPRNITSTQISYDASRVLEVTVQFSYDRYVFGAIDSYSKALKEAFTLKSDKGPQLPSPPPAPRVTE